jgi:hypothetical protein
MEKMLRGEGNEKNGGRRGKDDDGEEVKWLDDCEGERRTIEYQEIKRSVRKEVTVEDGR